MNSCHYFINFLAVILVLCGVGIKVKAKDIRFDDNYNVTWGNDHVFFINQGTEIQLSMDIHSGAGFATKLNYGSGFFHMRIKLPKKDSAGVVTAFYLSSKSKKRDEIDFEFLGNKQGKPITLQTNVFAYGQGNREQRTLLWFDPTSHFHSYKILWNQYHIVFYVDEIPIRVFKNNAKIGVMYPIQAMRLEASLWNGDSWATDGGQTKTNWSNAPFTAHFQDFSVDGCPLTDNNNNNNNNNKTFKRISIQSCYSSNYWWNQKKFWELDHNQQKAYEQVRKVYMNYDYCDDRHRYPNPPIECIHQLNNS